MAAAAAGEMVMKICKWLHELKPVLLMVAVQFFFAGVNVLFKLATYDGRAGLSLHGQYCFKHFSAASLGSGSLSQNLYFEGLVLTSATFATAMANVIPGFTFILAASFGLEKMGISTLAGKAKVAGTLMGIGGAMLLTFCKGAEIHIWSTHVNLMKLVTPHGGHVASSDGTRAKMSAKYPCPYSSTALMSTMAAIQSVVYTFCVEKDWSQWKLGWNIRLLTAAYALLWMIEIAGNSSAWDDDNFDHMVRRIKGPMFATIFYPLMLVFTALAGSLLLDEDLHLGSIMGATFIVCGLYAVLWGKVAEMKTSQLIPLKNSEEVETTNSTSKNDNGENLSSGKIHGKEEKEKGSEEKV
ncbi:hypothetical protein GH714_038417 [Hevea brasiliensis]|uniref:WAT1-related protein n=1 Tax=Hevea brasiliensis TaxID=3981 RepID=A0A6A6N9M4_HEVBR|nr:hypothetical protein GH714_038417 [Hevea brasiliensis]